MNNQQQHFTTSKRGLASGKSGPAFRVSPRAFYWAFFGPKLRIKDPFLIAIVVEDIRDAARRRYRQQQGAQ